MIAKRYSSIILLLAVLVVANNSIFTISPGENALVLRFGKISAEYKQPGMHFKWPFVTTVSTFDVRTLTLDDQSQNVTTANGREVKLGYYAKWRVADLQTYYRATGGQSLQAMDRLSTLLNNGVNSELSKMTLEQIASSGSLLPKLGDKVQAQIKALGVKLVDLRVRDMTLPTSLVNNAYARMRSERESIASNLRAQGAQDAARIKADADANAEKVLADAQRQADEIRGDADATAARIYAKAYGQDPKFFSFYRSLKTYEEALGKHRDVFVLKPDSHFFRYFNGPKQ